QLDPTRVLTNTTAAALAFEATEIKLSARLSERKVRWAETRHRVGTKQAPQKLCNRSLQVCQGYASVDTQTFNLEEHRVVSRIRSVAPKHTAGRDHPDGHAPTLHCVDLHGGGLRAKRETLSRVERVLPGAGRMIQGDVEGVKVVEVS